MNELSNELSMVVKRFLDSEGRIRQFPTKMVKQIEVLKYLASKFEPGRVYSEKEVNAIIEAWHTYGDWAALRRALCDQGYLSRKNNGSEYWLP